MDIIFVTQFSPSPVGHGGDHRAYQIYYDLCSSIGSDKVHVLSLHECQNNNKRHKYKNIYRRVLKRINKKFLYYIDNPLRFFHKGIFVPGGRESDVFFSKYKELVNNLNKSVVVFIEHAGFQGIIEYNEKHDIPTIACVQNLESLEWFKLVKNSRLNMVSQMGDFGLEISLLSRCTERLFISKVEAGIIGGLGIKNFYYPYIPVGEIRENLYKLRCERIKTNQIPGLFLMLGSASHHTTYEAFSWFVTNAQNFGLPDGVRIIVGGNKTDILLQINTEVPGLEIKGWLEQQELNELLIKCQGILVPQFRGFGALTRLPEFVCVGIPIIISKHPTYAIDIPPGINIINDTWESWYNTINNFKFLNLECSASWEEYIQWEKSQPKIADILRKYLSK